MYEEASVAAAAAAVVREAEVALGRPERAAEACDEIRRRLPRPLGPGAAVELAGLLDLPARRSGPVLEPVADLLSFCAGEATDPWPYLDALLHARDPGLFRRGLDRCAELAGAGAFAPDRRAVVRLAEALAPGGAGRAGPGLLETAASVLAHLGPEPAPADPDPLRRLLLDPDHAAVRLLGARLLDRTGEPAPAETARALLGEEAAAFLAPYLAYTRAAHADLVALASRPGAPPPALDSLRRAVARGGDGLLRAAAGELGWPALNLGVEVRPVVGISVGGALPYHLNPDEAALFDGVPGARTVFTGTVVLAHGGTAGSPAAGSEAAGPIARFRGMNLVHAALLGDILDVAPLDRAKVERILAGMDRVVEDFAALFAGAAPEEAGHLPEVYRALKGRILEELSGEGAAETLSPELTRLVQMFEDPGGLAQVGTLHGLKRYLHQRGLRLGFRLMGSGGTPNRAVEALLLLPGGEVRRLRPVRYLDFEAGDPEPGADPEALPLPYPVRILVEGFLRHLLHGETAAPDVRVFCYGNEVHYYLNFGTHPAFLRVDFAPPLKGGMIDLEFYGVSKNVLGEHPAPDLPALQAVFRRLDFEITVEGTRVHARYDKERALDLGDLCGKAEAMLRLAPLLMDLDWTVGSLDLDSEGRRRVAEAWADRFARWGVLPVARTLTTGRTGILRERISGPEGIRERAWTGEEPYRDRFPAPPDAATLAALPGLERLAGPEPVAALASRGGEPAGQLLLEDLVLRPLAGKAAAGGLAATGAGYRPPDPALYRPEHEAERMARILAGPPGVLAGAASVAALLVPLERTLRFTTTGSVDGAEVQRAALPLRGETLAVYGMRDAEGFLRLAFFTGGDAPALVRSAAGEAWRSTASVDAAALAARLRRSQALTDLPEPGAVPARAVDPGGPGRGTAAPDGAPLPGERVVSGRGAAPGRAVGPARFGTAGREPADLEGGVLVAACVRPEDTVHLYRAAAVVSTGGGILSHAGLIAVQFGKPALIVDGRWIPGRGSRPVLALGTEHWREETREVAGCRVVLRRDFRTEEILLADGDLVAVEADADRLRVLGQGRDALALHAALGELERTGEARPAPGDPRDALAVRGRRLRSRHALEKLLERLDDPVLAGHAVEEILLGRALAGPGGGSGERSELLALLLANPAAAEPVRRALRVLAARLGRRRRNAVASARRWIPRSGCAGEILSLRLEALRTAEAAEEAARALTGCGCPGAVETLASPAGGEDVDGPARERLIALRCRTAREAQEAVRSGDPRFRHRLRTLARLDRVLETPAAERALHASLEAGLERADEETRTRLTRRRVLRPGDGGLDLLPLLGGKAANLAEVERLGGGGLVPPWFTVSHTAFRSTLDAPLCGLPGETGGPADGAPLREALAAVLTRNDLSHAGKALRVAALWERARLSDALVRDVTAAYRALAGDPAAPRPPVAVRSSAREEDTEAAARAGEFDTFLCVRGEEPLLATLRRAWSGLWTERAIHNRAVLGLDPVETGGGVVVQRMVEARVSGVLQTVNVAAGNLDEMVVNAGLGLGEGIVSGTVTADHVTVSKLEDPEREPLRFRYLTGDKREMVVPDPRGGPGTVRAGTLYHQRLRPALEYVELRELVLAARRLEAAYGYPLDIEFAIEGTRLWILQCRPVAVFLAALDETVRRRPLAVKETVS